MTVLAETPIASADLRSETPSAVLPAPGLVGIAILLFVYAGLWLYMTPYVGMGHDAQAYAVQALSQGNLKHLAGDIFLAFRSQEEFTVFPQIYAWFIDVFGLDHAAALLTITFQVCWFLAAFLLFRQLVGLPGALLSLGLIVTIPGNYGGMRVFSFAEGFLTARLPAEVLSLLTIWLCLRGRTWISAAAAGVALLIHPLMGFPTAIWIALHRMGLKLGWRVVPILTIGGVVAAIGGSYLIGGVDPIMDGRWLAITEFRSGFLFLNHWTPLDWNFALQSFLTLILGASVLRSTEAGRSAYLALWVGVGGLALTAVTTFIVQLDILIQGQPWRWTWLARLLAIGLLPAILLHTWQSSKIGRASAMLLVAGWYFVVPLSTKSAMLPLFGSGLALGSVVLWFARGQASEELAKLSLFGSKIILGAVFLSSLVTISLGWTMASSVALEGEGHGAALAGLLKLITPSILVAVAAGIVTVRYWTRLSGVLLGGLGLILFAAAGPQAAAKWSATPYSDERHDAFADWRAQIPTDTEVFWWEHLQETWFLLERRSYMTRSQVGGIVYSRDLADEVVRRALVLSPLVDPNYWIGYPSASDISPNSLTFQVLAEICRDPELGYVVATLDFGLESPRKHWPSENDTIYLHDCSRVRTHGNLGNAQTRS